MLKPFSGKWGPKWRFREKWGSKPLTLVLRPPKKHFLARNRVFWRILRQNLCSRLDCSLSREPLPLQKTPESLCPEGREITHTQKRNLWTDLDKILLIGRYLRYYHLGLYKFWWPSVKGFLGGGGSNFPFPINFHRRPYHTLALPCQKYLIFSSSVVCCGLLWFLLRSRLWSPILCPVHVAAL